MKARLLIAIAAVASGLVITQEATGQESVSYTSKITAENEEIMA